MTPFFCYVHRAGTLYTRLRMLKHIWGDAKNCKKPWRNCRNERRCQKEEK